MLTSAKVSQSEPAIIGLEPLGKRQALPQEAKFSDLFSSMYSASKKEPVAVLEPATLNVLPEESGGAEGFSIANDLLETSAEGELPGLVNVQLENGSLNSNLTKPDTMAANADIMTLVENALASTEVVEITNVTPLSIDSIETSDVEKHLSENFNVHQVLDKQVSMNNVDVVGEVRSQQLVSPEDAVELAVQQQVAEMSKTNPAPAAIQMANSAVVSNANQAIPSASNSNSSASQGLTQWGTANSEMQQASSATAQNNQSFSQGSQQQFSGQQQMMQFQAQKSQAIEQQMAVKVTDELIVKADSKESLLNGEFSASDRRMQLPVGLQSIPIPVKSPQWGQALGQRVVFMANNQLQQAQITLNPEKLGPVQVKLHMDKEQQVHVTMTAQHGTTREAMENALPRLREMLEQSGINLGSVDVGDNKQFSDNNSPDSDTAHTHAQTDGDEANLNNDMSPTKVIATDNIVDFYA